MAIIETCLVEYKGEHGWGLISDGVLCPTISLCMSEHTAGSLAEHGYPGHTVRRWADEDHSHDATRHKTPPWSRIKWPPGPKTGHEQAVDQVISAGTSATDRQLAREVVPEPAAAPAGATKELIKAVIQLVPEGGVQIGDMPPTKISDLPQVIKTDVEIAPPRKSLLVRRPLVTVNNPPLRVDAEFKEYPREPVKTVPAQVGVFKAAGPMQTLDLRPPDPIPAPVDALNHGVLVAKAAPVVGDVAADNTRVYGRPLTLAEKLALRKAQQ